jgi:hypothetical protein
MKPGKKQHGLISGCRGDAEKSSSPMATNIREPPLANCFIGHDDPTSEQELFHVSVAETKAEVQPDAIADDFNGKTMIL